MLTSFFSWFRGALLPHIPCRDLSPFFPLLWFFGFLRQNSRGLVLIHVFILGNKSFCFWDTPGWVNLNGMCFATGKDLCHNCKGWLLREKKYENVLARVLVMDVKWGIEKNLFFKLPSFFESIWLVPARKLDPNSFRCIACSIPCRRHLSHSTHFD